MLVCAIASDGHEAARERESGRWCSIQFECVATLNFIAVKFKLGAWCRGCIPR